MNTTTPTTFDQIRKILVDDIQLPHDIINPESLFVDELGIDSLDLVTMVLSVEEHFDIEIPDDEIEKINTVAQLVAYIDGHARP